MTEKEIGIDIVGIKQLPYAKAMGRSTTMAIEVANCQT